MGFPPQGKESLERLVIRGTEVISSGRVLRNIERFEPVVPFKTRYYGVMGVPPPSFNAFGFCPVYKAEEYDFATETWIDVTENYNWDVLTDNKGNTHVTISTTAGVNRRFRIYIDMGANVYVSAVVIYFGDVNLMSECIVESSTYADFSADVATNVNWTGDISIAGGIPVYFYIDPAVLLWRRYVRITFTVKRNSDGTMYFTQVIGLTAYNFKQFERHIPHDWDYNRNIYPIADNSKDLGTSSKRWRDLWVGRNVYIAGNVGIGTTTPSEKLVVGIDLGNVTGRTGVVIGDSTFAHLIVGKDNNNRGRFSWNGSSNRLEIESVEDTVVYKYFHCKEGNIYAYGNIRAVNHVYPNADNTYDLGSSSLRWANGYFVNVVTGDIGFEELSCPVCNQPFKVNDSVVLKVRKVDNDKIMCVPVHTTCNPHELPPEEIAESEKEEDKLLEIIPEPSFEITAVEPIDEKRMYVQAKFEDGIVVWAVVGIEASEDEITEKLKEAYVNEKKRIIEDEERKRKGAEKLKMKERLIGMKKKVEIKADEIKRAEAV